MTIKCAACQSITVSDDALCCFKCGRKFRDQDRVPLRLIVLVILIGLSLPLIFVLVQNNFHHVRYFLTFLQR
jgi:hypothetical protein